jgi:hypothetical protein
MRILRRLSTIIALLGIIVCPSLSPAGFLGALKRIGRVATFPVTAPTETIINSGRFIAGQTGPGAIISPYRRVARSSGQLLGSSVRLAAFPYQQLNRRAQYIANLAGEPGAFVFDISTFTNRYFNELGISAGNSAALLLQQSNPLLVVATPLAAAIHAARERHIRNARPIPASVRESLSPYFPWQVLNRAKYAVGRTDITFSNFIDQLHRFEGDDFAVTVDDIIVFNTDPGDFQNDPEWWAHEMTHVEQYWRWGVESFAYNYMVDHSAVEAEADNRARDIVYNRILADRGPGYARLARQVAAGTTWSSLPNRDYVTYDQSGRLVSDYYIAQLVLFGYSDLVNYLVTQQGAVLSVDVRSGSSYQVGWAIPPRRAGSAWAVRGSESILDVMSDGRVLQYQPRRGTLVVGQVLSL